MINTRFWNDGFISNLDPIEKLLFVYFITNEHTNICGIYELPLKVAALETGIDVSMFNKILPRLKEKIEYIEGWVVVKNFLRHQTLSSEKTRIGIKMALALVPSRILSKAVKHGYWIDGVSMPHGSPSGYSDPNSNSNSDPNSPSGEDGFETFWEEYPRKVGKLDARKVWLKLRPSQTLAADILAAVASQKQSKGWKKDNGQFIPHPATWLNQGRWMDAVSETKPDFLILK